MNQRLTRAAALLFALLVLLTGCGSKSNTQPVVLITPEPTENVPNATVQPGGDVTVSSGAALSVGYVAAQGSDLHPLRGNARDLSSLNSLVFESLVELDENRRPVALLCDRWEYSTEEGVWYFYLRDGIVFHDGSPLTADDVVASYEDIIINSEISPYYNRVRYLNEVSAVDNLTGERG